MGQQNNQGNSYRETSALPFELVEHCGIYFEENLCRLT